MNSLPENKYKLKVWEKDETEELWKEVERKFPTIIANIGKVNEMPEV